MNFEKAFHNSMAEVLDLPVNIFKFAAAECADERERIEGHKEFVTHLLNTLEGFQHAAGDFTYFIEGGGLVKIGHSINPDHRLKSLQTMSPVALEILAVLPGDYDVERQLHHQFADLRMHGEWFRPDERLLRLIIETVLRYGTWEQQRLQQSYVVAKVRMEES